MSKINSFEDLKVWQLARMLSKDIYLITQKDRFSKDFSLKDQINRSAGSTMDNIAEGFERGGNKEFVQFLYIAKGSCGELRSQLVRAVDRMYIDNDEFIKLNNEAIEISKQLSGFISYLKNSDLKGEKYIKEPKESYGSKLDLEF
ncbi:MAG: four helix bundle protein [Cyclobacteriaceae bacterium]|jgi:four helix bundle protein|nr:four helix bundle protein [Cyclobacteriaceae bacterium]